MSLLLPEDHKGDMRTARNALSSLRTRTRKNKKNAQRASRCLAVVQSSICDLSRPESVLQATFRRCIFSLRTGGGGAGRAAPLGAARGGRVDVGVGGTC